MAYFLRQMSRTRGTYLVICKTYRVPGKKYPKQDVIESLGYIDDLKEKGIDDPIAFYSEKILEMNGKTKVASVNNEELTTSNTSAIRHLGYFPLRSILNRLEVASDIDLFQLNRPVSYSYSRCLSALIYSRAVKPASKHKTALEVIPCLYGDYSFTNDQILDFLDFAGNNYSKLVKIFSHHVNETYDLDTSNVYFDCTNYYFEIDREDDFRKKGPSKENRKDPIICMGLLLGKNCIPIGMRFYPGNQSEKPVLRETIHDLKMQNNIKGKTVQIADKGLNCAQNIIDAVDHGDGYLFSKSIKGLSDAERSVAISPEGNWVDIYSSDGTLKYRYKEWKDNYDYSYKNKENRRFKKRIFEKRIVTYNPKLAEKQRREVRKMEEKAKKCMLCEAKKKEYGESAKYCDFVSVNKAGELTGKKARVTINQEAIEKDLAACGFNMLITSEVNMSAEEIYDTYHTLWGIEESFRCLKSELDARPVFLQKEDRIKGHFLICYLTVLLERLLQFKALDNQFGSHAIYDFIRDYNIAPNKYGDVSTNLSASTPIAEYLRSKFNLPVNVFYLTQKNIKALLERQF